jgi:hypothetical protein
MHNHNRSIIANLSDLRLPQQYSEFSEVEVLTKIGVSKPKKQSFFRVHPDPEMRLETLCIESEEDREWYLIDPKLWPDLVGEARRVAIVTCITLEGSMSLWPIKLPGQDGRTNSWIDTALACADQAKTKWVRLVPSMKRAAYLTYASAATLAEPKWPNQTLDQLIKLGFGNRYISSLDHELARKLRGEL